jgi:hypothetical protein
LQNGFFLEESIKLQCHPRAREAFGPLISTSELCQSFLAWLSFYNFSQQWQLDRGSESEERCILLLLLLLLLILII